MTIYRCTCILVLAALLSCKKDSKTSTPDPTPIEETGSLKIEFRHVVDTSALVFGSKYRNANGDTFTVSKFNYFISNVVLVKSDNSTYAEPNSYHLVRHSVAGSNILTLSGVPLATFKSIRFLLGVDSTRNVSGSQTGDLDPAKVSDMYWNWNSGYIFLKFEGSSPKSGDLSKALTFHIGGYAGVNKTQRDFSFDLGASGATVSKTQTPNLKFWVDVNELFKTPTKIDFSVTFNQTTAGTGAKKIADNYADMISFKGIQN